MVTTITGSRVAVEKSGSITLRTVSPARTVPERRHDADIRVELAGRRVRKIAGAIQEVVAVPVGHDAGRGVAAHPFQRRADGEAIGEGLDERHARMVRRQPIEAHALGIDRRASACSP